MLLQSFWILFLHEKSVRYESDDWKVVISEIFTKLGRQARSNDNFPFRDLAHYTRRHWGSRSAFLSACFLSTTTTSSHPSTRLISWAHIGIELNSAEAAVKMLLLLKCHTWAFLTTQSDISSSSDSINLPCLFLQLIRCNLSVFFITLKVIFK